MKKTITFLFFFISGIYSFAQLNVDIYTFDVSNSGSCDGQAEAVVNDDNGVEPYSYEWSHTDTVTSQIVFPLCEGTYSCTVTDANGQTGVGTTTIGVQPPHFTGSSAYGMADTCGFELTMDVQGGSLPYSYQWSHDAQLNSNVAPGLCVGMYYITVTDANNETSTGFYDVVASSNSSTVVIQLNAIYHKECNSSPAIDVAAFGGTGNISYLWSNGVTENYNQNIDSAGVYTVTATADNGVSAQRSFTITDSTTPAVIEGTVVLGSDTNTVVGSGSVILFSVNNSWDHPDTVAVLNVDAQGNFSYSDNTSHDLVVMYVPNRSVTPNGVTTYYFDYDDVQWGRNPDYRYNYDSASVAGLTECESTTLKIRMIGTYVLTGDNTISGTLINNDTLRRAGDPLPGIDVSLEQIPGGIVATDVTDGTGKYQFDNVPSGEYKIHVNIPGATMLATYDVDLTGITGSTVENQDFQLVASGITTPNGPTTNIIEFKLDNIKMYPNPSNGDIFFTLNLESSTDVSYEIYNFVGERIATKDLGTYHNGMNTFQVTNLSKGLYTIAVRQGAITSTFKALIVE